MENVSETLSTISDSTSYSENSVKCRFCFSTKHEEDLINPCYCKGTMEWIHLKCLERWLNTMAGRVAKCEVCSYKYDVEKTLKYGMIESLKIWKSEPHNVAFIRFTLLLVDLSLLLFFATFMLNQLVHPDDSDIFFKEYSSIQYTIIITFSSVLNFLCTYLAVHELYRAWYTWWKSIYTLRLIYENPKIVI